MKPTVWYVFFIIALLILAACSGPEAGTMISGSTYGGISLSLTTYANGLSSPVSMTNAGDERLFVVEQHGWIKIVEAGGAVLETPFLDINERVDSSSNEEGLLGLAFHPDYANNGYFYVNYTNTTDDIRRTRISRFSVTADPNIADPDSENILLTVTQPFSNHNAGDIHFGPDGYLYIPLGDGGSNNDHNSQDTTNLLGAITRIDVDQGPGVAPDCVGIGTGEYTIPAGNPFAGDGDDNCDEIWAYGLRNPWRSSFDRETGNFFIGDVGQSNWEEVDFQPSSSAGGENYGWRCYEGNHEFNTTGCGPIGDYVFPIFEYSHDIGCSIVGGYVYRGSLYPAMAGRYLLTDYCTGTFWDLEETAPGNWAATSHQMQQTGFTAFGESVDGELFLAIRGGTIFHLEAIAVTPTPTTTPPTPTATGTPTPTVTATATATPIGTPVHLPVIQNGEK